MIKIDNETIFSCCNGCGCQLGDIKRIRFSSDNGNSGITIQLCKECREDLVKLVDPLCCADIDNTAFKVIVENSIGEIIKNRIEASMDNYMAYWFSQKNIMDQTTAIIENMIDEEFVKEAAGKFDVKECREYLSKRLADCIINQMGYDD